MLTEYWGKTQPQNDFTFYLVKSKLFMIPFIIKTQTTLFSTLFSNVPVTLREEFLYRGCGCCCVLLHSRQDEARLDISPSYSADCSYIRCVQGLAGGTMSRSCSSHRNTDSFSCRPICTLSYILPAASLTITCSLRLHAEWLISLSRLNHSAYPSPNISSSWHKLYFCAVCHL